MTVEEIKKFFEGCKVSEPFSNNILPTERKEKND
jgi:hypothetical protein